MGLIPKPEPISKELLEVIEKTKRDIEAALLVDNKSLGKNRHPLFCECPDCNLM